MLHVTEDTRRESRRVAHADGAGTTVHVVRHPLAAIRLRVVAIQPEAPLEQWCAARGVDEAVSGGFATKPGYDPLGALVAGGEPVAHTPFVAPWDERRPALWVRGDDVRIDYLPALPAGPDHLLQAGPLLVREGRDLMAGQPDPDGFSSTAGEFDQDLTADREPRLAIGLTEDAFVAVAADGRAPQDAGMTLGELATFLVELGARCAMNLDGGSAGVAISDGRRRNTPRTDEGEDMEASSPSVSAIVVAPAG